MRRSVAWPLLLALALTAPAMLSQESGDESGDKPARTEESERTEAANEAESPKEEAASPAGPAGRAPRQASATETREAPESTNQRPAGLLDPRDFPEGLTVLQPRRDVDPAARTYPEGVTVLGPGRSAPEGPRIRVRVEPGAPSPELPELEDLPPPEDPATGTSLGPTGTQEGGTIGPNVGEQQEAFREPPRTGGNVMPPYVGWQPESAYPDADIANPYPWNPSTWIESVFDDTWKPSSSWPAGQDRRNWSPVRWITPSIASTWMPEDAWGRALGIPGPREAQVGGPSDAAEPADAGVPGDAQSPEETGAGGGETGDEGSASGAEEESGESAGAR